MRNYANPALNSILDRPSFQGSFVRSTGGPNSTSYATGSTGQELGITPDFNASVGAPGFSVSGRISTAFLGATIVGLVAFNFVTRKVQL